MPEVSIVIPCYNRWDLTSNCLAALSTTTGWIDGEVEVILVDNGSEDSTRYAATDVVIRNFANRGFAVGCNQGGLLATASEIIVFLNNDTVPAPGWLQSLCVPFREVPEVGVVGSRLTWPDGSLQHAGIDLSYPGGVLTAVNVAHERESDYAIAVTGACMAMRTATFDMLGGFDSDFQNGYEDVDLCLRAWQLGWRVWYEADSTVMHVCSASGDARWAHVQENIDLLNLRWGGATDELESLVAALHEDPGQGGDGRVVGVAEPADG